MKQKRSRWARVVAVGVLAGIGLSAEASLTAYTANSVNLVYDDDLGATGLTWMQDANLFKTQAAADVSLVNQIIGAAPTITDGLGSHTVTAGDFDISTGHMTWWGAQAWVGYLNSISFAGVTGWRLPQAKPVHGNSFNYNFSVDGTSDVGYNGTTVNPYASELAHMFYNELGNKAILST